MWMWIYVAFTYMWNCLYAVMHYIQLLYIWCCCFCTQHGWRYSVFNEAKIFISDSLQLYTIQLPANAVAHIFISNNATQQYIARVKYCLAFRLQISFHTLFVSFFLQVAIVCWHVFLYFDLNLVMILIKVTNNLNHKSHYQQRCVCAVLAFLPAFCFLSIHFAIFNTQFNEIILIGSSFEIADCENCVTKF